MMKKTFIRWCKFILCSFLSFKLYAHVSVENIEHVSKVMNNLQGGVVHVKRLKVAWEEQHPISWTLEDEQRLDNNDLIRHYEIPLSADDAYHSDFFKLFDEQIIATEKQIDSIDEQIYTLWEAQDTIKENASGTQSRITSKPVYPDGIECVTAIDVSDYSPELGCTNFRHSYKVYRIYREASTSKTIDTWNNMQYQSPLGLTPGKAYRLPKNTFMMARVLTTPISKHHKKVKHYYTDASDLKKQESNFYDSSKAYHISVHNNLRDKEQFLDALIGDEDNQEIFKQNNAGDPGDGSFAGHFIMPGVSASLFQGGFNFEPYFFHATSMTATWQNKPRGGILIETPAKNILGASAKDFNTPWSSWFYRQPHHLSFEFGSGNASRIRNRVLNRPLRETPHEISTMNVKSRNWYNWNEVYYTPAFIDDSGKMSSSKITGFFVYTPEDDWTKWPEKLKLFYKLAELNKLPLIIIWNE